MNGDLCSDVIGTNPKYPPIVDHSWLDVDLTKYDNYPSDNNPLRVVPKLYDLWNHSPLKSGVNLVPNAQIMPLGVRAAEDDARQTVQVVKEAKKAVMSGLKGRELSDYLRARFSSKYIEAAKEELKKVAGEIGLLGNVYIDASAFNSFHEAEQFLAQNRTRLAQDLLVAESLDPNVVHSLAFKFHKNVTASVTYDEKLFNKYREHLIQAGRIPEDMVIASKEDLRQAFLFTWPKAEQAPVIAKEEKKIDPEQVKKASEQESEKVSMKAAEEHDAILLSKISPIVSFVQENLSKGKTASSIKEMIRSKYAMSDIKDAAEALGIVLSEKGLDENCLDSMMKQGSITLVLGQELKKIGKQFPIKKAQEFSGEIKTEKTAGTFGRFYSLQGKRIADKNENYRLSSLEALKKGYDINDIKKTLCVKLSAEDADQVILDAVMLFNNLPAGVQANKHVKAEKAKVEDPTPRQTLPDPSTIASQTQEILSTFDGCGLNVEIDPLHDYSSLAVEDFSSNAGIDQTIR